MFQTRPDRRTQHGITLLEMLIVLTVLGVLLGLAVPALDRIVARIQSSSARTAMTATLFDAQRNATVLGRHVAICPGSEAGCIGGHDWSRGWIAFIDENADRQRGPDETVIRREPPLSARVRLFSTIGRPRIVYQPNGDNAGTNVTFTLCDRRGPEDAIALILANGGRLRSARPSPAAAAACAAGL